MGDFFAFRRMLAPVLIQILFWIMVLSSLALGGAIFGGQIDAMKEAKTYLPDNILKIDFIKDNIKIVAGLYFLIVMPILIRLYFELLMLPFRINGTLTDIRNTLLSQGGTTVAPPAPRR